MKLLAGLLVIMMGVVLLGFWTNNQLHNTSGKLLDNIENISRDISGGKWESATIKLSNLERNWEKQGAWWPVIMDHQEMDNIEFTMARLKGYVKSGDAALSKGELEALKIMIEHIPIKEAISIKNIL